MSLLQIIVMIVFPPLAGFIIYHSGVKLFGKSDMVFHASLALAGIVGIGFLWSIH